MFGLFIGNRLNICEQTKQKKSLKNNYQKLQILYVFSLNPIIWKSKYSDILLSLTVLPGCESVSKTYSKMLWIWWFLKLYKYKDRQHHIVNCFSSRI